MSCSTHYYVLSLGPGVSALYEAFRDSLIAIEDGGFPLSCEHPPHPGAGPRGWYSHARRVDLQLRAHHTCDPLHIVVAGPAPLRAAFAAVTIHAAAIAGWVDGDHQDTTPRDLGQIAWPLVRMSMSAMVSDGLQALRSAPAERLVCGLEAVVLAASAGAGGLLLVEEDYHRRGTICLDGDAAVLSPEPDIRNALDDSVDAVLETVLKSGGRVLFVPPRTLLGGEHIVLMRDETRQS